jgi:hypothetical protein
MELTRLSDLFEVSPAVRLLRSHHAAFVLHFCNSTFKHSDTSGAGTFAHDDLRRRLACYQEDLADDGYEVLVSPADHYLTTWADEGWLRRFLKSDSNEPHYQLTRHTEDAAYEMICHEGVRIEQEHIPDRLVVTAIEHLFADTF